MTRRLILTLVFALIGGGTVAAASAQGPTRCRIALPLISSSTQRLLITGLHYDGIISGEPDEAFEIYNPNDFTMPLAGWRVRSGTRSAGFPAGMALAPRGSLWCGREATAFRRSFGHLPQCEWAKDTEPQVPNLLGASLSFANTGGVLALLQPNGTTSDVLVYKGGSGQVEVGWQGSAVWPYTPSATFHEQGQVLFRKLDQLTGLPAYDTDRAGDWASDSTDVLTGRRVRYAGWALERFVRPVVSEEWAHVEVFVTPDHAYEALTAHIGRARQSIRFEGYTLESAPVALALAQKAAAGVAVTVLLEGAPPGGVSLQQRWSVQQIAQAGGAVFYMRSNAKAGIHDRYANQHAKLWLLDDRVALIGSENPSPDSFPDDDKSDGTLGRRGVYIATDAPGVVGRANEIMRADLDLAFADLWRYDPADIELGAPPPEFNPTMTSGGNGYQVRVESPLSLYGRQHFEVCQAPEHSQTNAACLLGLVNRVAAGDTLLVQQLAEPLYWGPNAGTVESDPNPRLQAYLAAARRGAQVRILLDAFFDDLTSSRSNLRTEEYLMSLARAEGLDLEVRRGNPTGLGLHNKMVLAQVEGRGWAMAGSLNGGEASAKVNREVSLVVQADEVYHYLADMFWNDWR